MVPTGKYSQSPTIKMRLWVGVLLMLCAAALYLHHVSDLSIWEDEAYTLHLAQQPDLTSIMDYVRQDTFPQLFYFALHGWQSLVGEALIASRMVTVWATLLGTALTYRLVLDTGTPRAAVVATLIVMTSDIVLSYVPFARHYPIYMMLATLVTWCYWRLSCHWSWGWTAAYIVTASVLIYTAYWGAFILITHGLHALIYHRRRLPILALILITVTIIYIPALPVLVDKARGGSLGVGESGGYMHSIPLDRSGLNILFSHYVGIPVPLFIVLGLAGLVNTWSPDAAWLDRLPPRGKMLIGLWAIVPVLLPILITLGGYKLISDRATIALVPALAALIGYTLAQMPRWVYSILLVIILWNNAVTRGMDYPVHGPWWDTTDLLETMMSPQDALYIESGLRSYAIEQHARQVDLPYQIVIRSGPVTMGWLGEDTIPIPDRLMDIDSLWVVEHQEIPYTRTDLAAYGFVLTTPKLDFGLFNGLPVSVYRLAKVPDAPLVWKFGTEMQLAALDWWQSDGTLHVNMTWLALARPSLDYTVVTFLMGSDGQLVTQYDSYPLGGRSPTTTWEADTWHFDRHNLDLSHVPPGDYRLGVRIYTWWDMVIQPVTPCDAALCEQVFIDTIHVP